MEPTRDPDPRGGAGAADPTPIFELSVAYWRSATLFAALDLGLFDALAGGPLAPGTLAARLGLPERPVGLLAEALVALGLLRREDSGRFANTPLSEQHLLRGAPASLRDAVLFNARHVPAWMRLAEAVRRDAPVVPPDDPLGDDAEATRSLALAMHARAQGVARCLVDFLDLAGRRRLLDVAGGPATYARLLAEKHPDLEVTVVDRPGVLAVAEELVKDSPARSRLRLQPGDVLVDGLGSGYDAVLLSGILHRTAGDGTRALLRKASGALVPGGLVAVSDLFTGGPARGPVLPELFSLFMLLTAEQGGSLSLEATRRLLKLAGLRPVSVRPYPPPLPHTLVTAVREDGAAPGPPAASHFLPQEGDSPDADGTGAS